MHIVRIIGMIFLSIYLFFNGLYLFSEKGPSPLVLFLIGVCGMAAGVLILISIGRSERRQP